MAVGRRRHADGSRQMKQTKHRQRTKAIWATPVAAMVAVLGVGIWVGSTRTQLRSTLPTLMFRTKTGFLQLRTAVRSHLGITPAAALDSAERTSGNDTRVRQRRPRVVPFSKKP